MLEGPVYKRESIIMGHNIRKQVGVNMDWGLDVAKHAMFRVVSFLTKMCGHFCRIVSCYYLT